MDCKINQFFWNTPHCPQYRPISPPKRTACMGRGWLGRNGLLAASKKARRAALDLSPGRAERQRGARPGAKTAN